MDNGTIDILTLVGDIAIEFLPLGDLTKAGLQLGLQAGGALIKSSGPRSPEEQLNFLINRGQFDEAERYVRGLNLTYESEQGVLSQIAEIRREYEAQMARTYEWNQKINSLVTQKQFNEAIRFVESLNVPKDQKIKIVTSIRDTMRRHEWGQKLNSLMAQEQFDEAIRFVKSIDLPKDQKKKIIASIRDMMRRRDWDQKLNSLLAQGKIDKAIRFVESLDLPGDQKTKIVESIRDTVRKREEEMRKFEGWIAELNRLVAKGEIGKAKEYVMSLPIDDKAKEAILSRLMPLTEFNR